MSQYLDSRIIQKLIELIKKLPSNYQQNLFQGKNRILEFHWVVSLFLVNPDSFKFDSHGVTLKYKELSIDELTNNLRLLREKLIVNLIEGKIVKEKEKSLLSNPFSKNYELIGGFEENNLEVIPFLDCEKGQYLKSYFKTNVLDGVDYSDFVIGEWM